MEKKLGFLTKGTYRYMFGSRAVDGKKFLESNASSILGTLT